MERKIYLFPASLISMGNVIDPIEPSEWNDLEELPYEAVMAMEYARENDLVWTLDNFMLDYNLADNEAGMNDEYLMFIPDLKFEINN